MTHVPRQGSGDEGVVKKTGRGARKPEMRVEISTEAGETRESSGSVDAGEEGRAEDDLRLI